MNFFKVILLGFAVFTISMVNAAAPNWSINPANYQYTMTVTATAKFSCTESTNPNSMVGAFINGNLAGYASINTNINGTLYAYVTVYSNVASGDTVQFKLYDASTDTLRDAIFTSIFQNNASIGNAANPTILKTDYDLDSLSISTQLMYEFYQIGQEVAYFTLIDETMSEEIANYSFVNDSLGADNASFSFTDSTLVLQENVDFLTKTSYKIHVMATTLAGCTINKNLVLTVVNSNSPPTDIAVNPAYIDENKDAGTLVTQLQAVDVSPNDSHTFELMSDSINFPDNAFFTIANDSLLSNTNFDYETKNEYTLQIKVTDNLLNYYVDTFTVLINDLVEFTRFEENPVYINENEAKATLISELKPANLNVSYTLDFALSADLTNFPDNEFFSIANKELLSAAIYDYETKKEYTIQVEVTTQFETKHYDTLTVLIKDVIEFDDLKNPNFLSPNGDNVNDFFIIPNVELYKSYTLSIFNNNGNKVFFVLDGYDNSWSGLSTDGKELPNGTYYFTFINNTDATEKFVGKIIINRNSKF